MMLDIAVLGQSRSSCSKFPLITRRSWSNVGSCFSTGDLTTTQNLSASRLMNIMRCSSSPFSSSRLYSLRLRWRGPRGHVRSLNALGDGLVDARLVLNHALTARV